MKSIEDVIGEPGRNAEGRIQQHNEYACQSSENGKG